MDSSYGEDKVFDLIGEEGFDRLIAAFYRQVPEDEILGPMYPKHDLEGARRRLRDFLLRVEPMHTKKRFTLNISKLSS